MVGVGDGTTTVAKVKTTNVATSSRRQNLRDINLNILPQTSEKNNISETEKYEVPYTPSMHISVVIPAYNEAEYLGKCLASVLKARTDSVKEILVIDNASTDTTAAVARGFPGVRVVREEQKGLTRARQCGLSNATGDVLAWMDADCTVNRSWFEEIERVFTQEPSTVCLSGPYRYGDGSVLLRAMTELYWWILAWPTSWIVGHMTVGGNFAARKQALIDAGGFDTTIAFYGEDTDISRRLHRVGKVRFSMRFRNTSSSRRLAKQGILKIGWIYVANFLSQVFLKRSVNTSYIDVR